MTVITSLLLAVSFALPQAEFAKYHREITGRDPAPDAVVFAIDPTVSKSGHDAYAIRSVEVKGKGEGEQLHITGSNMRSVWYGLYDLLERRGGCRWFWDADIIPKKDAIDLSGLDVREEARFEYRGIRYFAHRGLTRFQAEHWGPEDWRREIDWLLKRRLNVFMLRIGQDDLFQRTFPETCAYPDAAKDLPGHGRGYDNRTLFWSLEYRGKLRQDVQRYGRARGLMIPEDYGTMTHWYSRTPEDYLAKKNPPFLPQATRGYGERNGLVWDIRDDKWVDEYWKLTLAATRDYGEGADQQLLHTIGLGERRCFTNRQDNLDLKIESLRKFLARSHRDFPKAKNLLAGWDFYFTWRPEEVQSLVKTLDPQRDVVWDYEGDAARYYGSKDPDNDVNDFRKWGVVGKFPYTFSIFLAFESALDIRANYPLIEERQKIVQNDPMCAGYIFWPESSHTDTLLLEYFTANAWGRKVERCSGGAVERCGGHLPVGEVLDGFCVGRYGKNAAKMKAVWEAVIPLSHLLDWADNYGCHLTSDKLDRAQHGDGKAAESLARWRAALKDVKGIFAALAAIDWRDEAVRRDSVDLARTALDRLLILKMMELNRAYEDWVRKPDGSDALVARADELVFLTEKMADLLELHTDYSLWESYERLDRIEKIRNPNFSKVLFENATCYYCRSHQYEAARHLYLPRAREFAARVRDAVRAVSSGRALAPGQRELKLGSPDDALRHLHDLPLETLRPTKPRTPENFRTLMRTLSMTN